MPELVYRLGMLLPLFSGAAALAHEMLWTRRLVDLLGGASESNTRVLSLFFLGLSIGAIASQFLLSRIRRPWFAVAWTEIAIALLALPAYFLPELTDWLWPAIGRDALVSPLGRILKFIISILVVVPPATAMGMTLPFFVSGLLAFRGSLGKDGVSIYATNTFGGVIGLVFVGGILLPFIGAQATMAAAIASNFAIAAVCFFIDRRFTYSSLSTTEILEQKASPALGNGDVATEPPSRTLVFSSMLVAFGSGVGLLSVEVAALQTLMLAVPLSFFGPLAILATVVCLLAFAATAAREWVDATQKGAEYWLPRTLAATGLAAVISPIMYLFFVKLIGVGVAGSVFMFTLKIAFLVLLSFGPLFFLLGLTFPFAMMLYDQASPCETNRWPWLLAVNGIGGLIGAEITYRLLLPNFGVHVSIAILGFGYLTLAGLLVLSLRQSNSPSLLTLGGLALVLVAITNGVVRKLPQINPYLKVDVLSESVGADGLVAVIEGQPLGRAILVSNQYILGSTSVKYDQQRQTHLPLLLHPKPKHAGFIGLATGITPGAALLHDGVEQVTVAEIAKGVFNAADKFFAEHNESVTRSSKAKVYIEDGRTLVAASPESFDVLVGDLFLPWGAGASRLFSKEHFEAARRSLTRGGLFCQWLPMYQLNDSQFTSVCATFQSVFPDVHLFRNNADPMNPSLALIGYRDGALSWNTVDETTARLRAEDRVKDPAMRHWQSVAMHYLGKLKPLPPQTPLITLNNMLLEVDASSERVTGDPSTKYFQGERWLDFLSSRLPALTESDKKPSEDAMDNANEYQRLGLMIAKWQLEKASTQIRRAAPDTNELERNILDQMPGPILQSIRRWPDRWPGDPCLFGLH